MAHYHLAWFLALQGQMQEAIAEHIKAREADPLNPLHTAWLGELYRWNGQYDLAIAEARKSWRRPASRTCPAEIPLPRPAARRPPGAGADSSFRSTGGR